MSFPWTGCLVAVAGSLALVARVHATALLVPAYFDPNDHAAEWSRLTAAAKTASVTAIFNPNSGPGAARDPAYTKVLADFRAAGGRAVAYVHTSYADGSRSLDTVKAEIDRYRSYYAFDGIFVDEMTNDARASHLSYYGSLYQYVKSLNAAYTVVGNPGTAVPTNYAAVADVLVTYESPLAGYAAATPASWTQTRPASGFATMVFDAPESALAGTLATASARNAGYVYVTDDVLPNPYDTLPAYFEREVRAVSVPEPTVAAAAVAAVGLFGRRRRRARA